MKNRTSRQTPWLLTQSLRKSLKCGTHHELFTEQVNKVALSSSDNKRIIRADKIQTLAHEDEGPWGTEEDGDKIGAKGAETGAQEKCVRMNKSPLLPHSLQLALAMIVTRSDEKRRKRFRFIRDLVKALKNLCFRKQGATLANCMLCYEKIFVPIKLCH